MAKSPKTPPRDPAKHSRKDPAKPTRAKAARPDTPAMEPSLADLLNPAIGKGTAGVGAQTGLSPSFRGASETSEPGIQKPAPNKDVDSGRGPTGRPGMTTAGSGLQPPPDNSFDRRADFSAAHRARKSTKGFDEAPQSDYVGKVPNEPVTINTKLAASARLPHAGRRGRRRRHRAIGCDRQRPGAGPAAARGAQGICRPGGANLDAAPSAPPGEVRRRQKVRHQVRLRAQGRPAARDRRAGRRREAPRPHAGAARRHRLRQDLHHGQGDRAHAAPGADPRAQQDAGGPALRRVQELLSRQRGRVFRQLLRLLPAGSLRSAHRHLYREGILDQRADRPHAPFGDARAARTRRRHHRGVGVVHLRYRLGRDLFGDDVRAQARRAHQPAPVARRPGRAAIQAHRRRFLPRLVPGARRHRRRVPGALRGPRLAHQPVRRRGGIDRRVRSAHRPEVRRAGVREDLRQFALRDAAADADPGGREHQAGAEVAARPAQRRRAPPGGAAARATHHL